MKKVLLTLLCYTFISYQTAVSQVQNSFVATVPIRSDPNTNIFNMTWPEVSTDGFTAPVGLIDRLPPDGTWARFEQNDTSIITIASVGKMEVAQHSCRWIEVLLERGGFVQIWKLLIPEEGFKAERNIPAQALSLWLLEWREQRNVTGMSPVDEFSDLTFILTGPESEIRPLDHKTIETKLGQFECSGWTGRQILRFDQQEINATYQQWVHEKAPFGVLQSEIAYSIEFEGDVVQSKDLITLVEVGNGAKSQISTTNLSLEELTAQPFAPQAGWQWIILPESLGWTSMGTRGLALAADRKDQEFCLTLAYPWMPGGAEYRPVAFDANQQRFEFVIKSGAASGTVGLTVFTLAQNALPTDEIKYVGIEKQSQQTNKTQHSLLGQSLPSLLNVLFNSVPEQLDKKVLLICFFDFEQRPSRNCIMQLSERARELKSQDVEIIAVHASKIEQEKLDEWIKEQNISFPVGMIEGNEEEVRSNWGVKSLPWLILTDAEHIVTAEGFGLDELSIKIENE